MQTPTCRRRQLYWPTIVLAFEGERVGREVYNPRTILSGACQERSSQEYPGIVLNRSWLTE